MSVSGLLRSFTGLPAGSFNRVLARLFGGGPALAPFADIFEFFVREVLDADKRILRRAYPDKFIQLDLDGRAVPILRILDKKDHQERDDRGPRIDDKLPRIGVTEDRSRYSPHDNHQGGRQKRRRPPGRLRGAAGDFAEDVR